MKKVEIGSYVSVNYTGKLEDGTIFDSSLTEGREPLKAKLGEGALIKGFENGLIGMSVGETKTIQLEPSDAYGDVRPEFYGEIPKSQFPQDVKVGELLQGQGPNGRINIKVVAINEESVSVDANHPLAGKKLIFDLEVVDIN